MDEVREEVAKAEEGMQRINVLIAKCSKSLQELGTPGDEVNAKDYKRICGICEALNSLQAEEISVGVEEACDSIYRAKIRYEELELESSDEPTLAEANEEERIIEDAGAAREFNRESSRIL